LSQAHVGEMLAHSKRVAALISQVVTLLRPRTAWPQVYLLDHAGETARGTIHLANAIDALFWMEVA